MNQPPKIDESSLRIPGAFGRNFIGYFTSNFQKHGDCFQFSLFGKNFYAASHPKFIKHVLHDNPINYFRPTTGILSYAPVFEVVGSKDNSFTGDSGPLWRKLREASSPAYSQTRLQSYAPKMVQAALDLGEKWHPLIGQGNPVNVKKSFLKLSMYNMLFNLYDDINLDFDHFYDEAHTALAQAGKKSASFSKLNWLLPTKDKSEWKRSRHYMYESIKDIIDERIAKNEKKGDMLDGLIEAYQDRPTEEKFYEGLTSEILGLVLPGHETPGAALNSSLAILSQNPHMENNILDEIATELKGELPTKENIQKLTYLSLFIMELLRVRSPDNIVMRMTKEDDEAMGYHIPKGTTVILGLHWANRHPDFWDNPEGFDPERFRHKRWGQDEQYAYVPFGGGTTLCCGRNFSMMELTLTLATLLPRYRFTLLPGATAEHSEGVVGYPKGAALMKVEKRST